MNKMKKALNKIKPKTRLNKFITRQLFLIVAVFLFLIFTGSFAYLGNIIGDGVNTLSNISSHTPSERRFFFTPHDPVPFGVSTTGFVDGSGSITNEEDQLATLIKGEAESSATEYYSVYADFTNNSFVYTTAEKTAELLLNVVDPEGNEVTTIEGLTRVTVTDATGKSYTGFDVTEVNKMIRLHDLKEITTTSKIEEKWTMSVTFVDLPSSQTNNLNKELSANINLDFPNEMISGQSFNNLIHTSGFRDTVTQIIFDKQIDEGYEAATDKWDLSVAENESIVAYIENVDEEQILHIQSDRGIIANANQYGTFRNFNAITKLEFNGWYNTGNVTTMQQMFNMDIGTDNSTFEGDSYLTSLDLSTFDTSNVTSMDSMFYSLESITDLDLSSFDTSNVTNMSSMFRNMHYLTDLNINSFNTNNVTNMSNMFTLLESLKDLDLSMFNTSSVTNMNRMFFSLSSLTSLNLSSFDTSNVTDMSQMFGNVESLSILNLNNFNTENVTDMSYMFQYTYSLQNLDISSFNTNKVTDMSSMFGGCNSLLNLNLSNFETSSVTDMSGMFSYMTSLISLDITSFDTQKVTDMRNMFSGMNITSIDLSNFDMTNVTYSENMFRNSTKITEAYAKTQADADILNATTNKPSTFTFVATE